METSNGANLNNVDSASKRLNQIINDISGIYADSTRKITFKKKLENYATVSVLITEATRLIENLQEQITALDTSTANVDHIDRINEYCDLLTRNINFDETMHITRELFAISLGIPTTSDIFDNIEDEIIYEEQEVTNI